MLKERDSRAIMQRYLKLSKHMNTKNPYFLVFFILLYFFVTSMLGVIIGELLNQSLSIRPIGSIIVLVVFYIISWIGIFIYVKRFRK